MQEAAGKLEGSSSVMASGMYAQLRSKDAVKGEWEDVQKEQDALDKKEKNLEYEVRDIAEKIERKRRDLSKNEVEITRVIASIEKREGVEAQLKEVQERIQELRRDAHAQRESEKPLSGEVRRRWPPHSPSPPFPSPPLQPPPSDGACYRFGGWRLSNGSLSRAATPRAANLRNESKTAARTRPGSRTWCAELISMQLGATRSAS